MEQHVYTIRGLHCGGCVAKAQMALAGFGDRVTVTLRPARVVVEGSVEPSLADMNTALAEAGDYSLTPYVAKGWNMDKLKAWVGTYKPLLLIVVMLTVVSFAGEGGATGWMGRFMAGFFLVFSFFKLLNLGAFAQAYAGYDVIAGKWKTYGYVYPFLELALGLAYAFHVAPRFTAGFTVVLMGVSALGVIRVVREGRKIECACLGTVFKLPMSTVTIIEDLGMAVMAALMLVAM